MPDRPTREEIKKMFEKIMNEPRGSHPLPKLSPEAQREVDEAFDELDRVMGFTTEQKEKNSDPEWVQPTMTDAEIELGQLTDAIEGERRDEWFADPPENCDFCQVELLKRRYFVDGKLKSSSGWANMCGECFFEHGEAIRWGAGQAYLQSRIGEWLTVGGFPPED